MSGENRNQDGGERSAAPGRPVPEGLGERFKHRKPSRSRRLARTIVLGAVAVLFVIVWAAREYGMDTDELLAYALTSLLMVAGVVLLALFGALLLGLIKRLFR